MQKVTILIADQHSLFRQSLSQVLNNNPLFEVIADTGTISESIEISHKLSPAIILMDTEMPGVNRFELLKFIRSTSVKPKIIALASQIQPEYARHIISVGVKGYTTKFTTTQDIIIAIEEVNKGNLYLCKELHDEVIQNMFNTSTHSKLDSLTRKEMDIVSLVKSGYTSKQMAEKLALSAHTIMVHRYKILKKLNLKNSASLVDFIHYNYC